MSKKVLIVTYYWPPAGGPGVQRWLYFAKYLLEFEIQPVVFVPKNPDYPIGDSSLEKEISEQIEIIRYPILEPYALAKRFSKKSTEDMSKGVFPKSENQSLLQKGLLWVRGNCFVPDARVLWVKPATLFLKKYIQENHIGTVITTGPPHSVHLIGLGLKKSLGVKWMADFRDPWTSIGYHSKLKLNRAAVKKHLKLEQQVLDTCDVVLTTSKGTQEHFLEKTNNTVKVVTNGYEPAEKNVPVILDLKFTISHIGSLLSDRNPKILWEVLGELVREEKKFANQFKLQLAGVVSEEVLKAIDENGLTPYLDNKGYVDHSEALEMQKSSQLLLLIEIDSEETKQIIPGKLFEYLKANRPILGLAPKGSEVASIIETSGSGVVFNYDQKEDVKTHLYNSFRLFEKSLLKVSNTSGIEKYTRRSLTGQLATEIKELWV